MSSRPSAQAVPNPHRRLASYECPHAHASFVGAGNSHCGARFIFRSSYEDHWLTEHAPQHEHRPVWERAAAEMGLVPDEHGIISLSDAVLPPDRSGTVFIEDAVVGTQFASGGPVHPQQQVTIDTIDFDDGHYVSPLKHCRHPDHLARNQWEQPPRRPFNVKDALVFSHGTDWAPEILVVDGVFYHRYDLIHRKDTT